jgi:hypothetical protein
MDVAILEAHVNLMDLVLQSLPLLLVLERATQPRVFLLRPKQLPYPMAK